MLPPWIILDPLLENWLREDLGKGDRTTQGLCLEGKGKAAWIVKEKGVIGGLPIAARIFQLLDPEVKFIPLVPEGELCPVGKRVAEIEGSLNALLIGERVALNLVMRLSGIATLTREYSQLIADLPTQLVDTRKTTPGLRILEKYASFIGGAKNHRMGLDDSVMIKDNHIHAGGGIQAAIARVQERIPYPVRIEVETTTLEEVKEAVTSGADIIMLDNMTPEQMREAVKIIRQYPQKIKIEASGNVTLDNLRMVAQTGVDYISTSAPITRSTWLDISMKMIDNS